MRSRPGATLLTLAAARPIDVTWVVFSGNAERHAEARAAAEAFLADASTSRIELHDLPDGRFPAELPAVKRVYESLKAFRPDVVLTHHRHDAHQDHRTLAEAAWQTFRDHTILEYENVKFDADLGRPNVFVPVTEAVLMRKVELLREHYPTQASKQWFDDDTFRGLARIRGVECNSPTRFAEAFHVSKLTLAI